MTPLDDDFIRTAYVFDLYDGDTVYYHADLGYDVWATFLTGRLLAIDAPEIRPLATRAAGERAKQGLRDFIERFALGVGPFGHRLRVQSLPADNKWLPDDRVYRKGKYGRWLVTLWGVNKAGIPVNINELMVEAGFAEAADY